MKHLRKQLKAPFRRMSLRREWQPDADVSGLEETSVSVVLVTYNRSAFLEWCLDALLKSTAQFLRFEVIVWNNASKDDTATVLERFQGDPRVKVVNHTDNIGTNAYAHGFRQATGDWFLELDDDVLWFPDGWLEALLRAFRRLPRLGYLSTSQISDKYTAGSNPLTSGLHYYNRVSFADGTRIAFGSAAGHCALTPRPIYEQVGGFPTKEGHIFVSEDGHYNRMMRKNGYLRGILEDVEVYHAAGPHCNQGYWDVFAAKMADARALGAPGVHSETRDDLIPGFVEHFRSNYAAARG